MIWSVLFQVGASLLAGAAVGYGVSAIIDALSQKFACLWEGFIDVVKEIWGYVAESTQHILASILQWMDRSWSEIEAYLREEIGYRQSWLVEIFKKGQEVFVGFIDPLSSQGESQIASLGFLEPGSNVQLPEQGITRELVLQ